MRVCVTGSSGYIGRHVVNLLRTLNNVEIIEVSRTSKKFGFDVLERCDDPKIYELLGSPDVLVHLAWRNGFKHHEINHIEDLPKHYKFLKNMAISGCHNITVMGSMHEVGYFNGVVDECVHCNPSSYYGIAKNALRQLCLTELTKYVRNIKWLRGFYVYGDDAGGGNSIFSKLIEFDKTTGSINLTKGDHKFDFIEVNLLARRIALAAIQSEVTGIINVCSGKPMSLKEAIENYVASNNLKLKLNFGAYPERPQEPKIIYGDTTKISKIVESVNVKM